MRQSVRRVWWLFLVPLSAVAVLVSIPAANPLPEPMYLDLNEPAGKTLQIPADCSTWHELYPVYCVDHHQDSFQDNGDGVLSPCDYIVLDGLRYHVQTVTPTYFLSSPSGPLVCEPAEIPSGGNPTCEMWHEIYPDFCVTQHVDSWEDNGDGVLSVCDHVQLGGILYHVDRIGVDIFVISPPIAIESRTWGKIKSLFNSVF